ncbi:hypothetical protein HU742_018075 [Pseudomonas sp. SWRI102]|uniref:Uncharacterized protein n=1 Tax=Pseudomonas marvdashtae TaxID=2745500 RepID=A0A923FMX5_9PSED|nr:hypothetical protein [Pseudomonas marvdashtae]MBV4553056.1 hypothetical protein [Pseudomonas marvdashtae]
MATQEYKVKSPDGQVITLRGPAGASQEQVIAQAKKLYAQRQAPAPEAASAPEGQAMMPEASADSAPPPADVEPEASAAPEEPGLLDSIGNMITGNDRQSRATQELPELQNSGLLAGLDIPAGKAAAVTAALVTMTDPQEIAQTLKALSPEIGIQQDEKGNLIAANNATGARAMINKPGFTGMDALQATGIGAAFAPTGRAASAIGGGALKQAAVLGGTSAATQALIEGGQAAAGGNFDQNEVALSGATGAALPLAMGAGGAVMDAAKRGVQVLRGAPAAQSEIVQAAKAAKIPLMTSDVAPPGTFIGKSAQAVGERIPLAGTGGLRATQQEARQRAIQELGDRYPTPKPDQVIEGLKAQKSKVMQAAGKRYEELLPMVDSLGPAPYPKTVQAIDDAISELSKPGVVSSKEAVQELQQFKDTLGAANQTYSTLKENRTALREVVSSYDNQGRSQLPTRAKALMNRVYSALSGDMEEAATAALSPRDLARLKSADSIYRGQAEKMTRTRLKTVLDKGDLTPEVAENLLFSNKRSEVKSLYESLDSSGRDAARATVIQRALTKAGGLDNPSPEKFIAELRRMESQTGILFKGEQRKQLEGLKLVLAATKRAGEAGVQTATGQQLYAPLGAAAAGSLIGDFGATLAAGASVGAMARAYESPVVRNAMIRIGSAPKSEASKRLALQLARQLNAGAQSARAQEIEEPQR